jgi:hypothetical protein
MSGGATFPNTSQLGPHGSIQACVLDNLKNNSEAVDCHVDLDQFACQELQFKK